MDEVVSSIELDVKGMTRGAGSGVTGVSVAIPTKNGGPLFREVLGALHGQRLNVPWELIIIDSGSSDGTVEVAAAHGAKVLCIDPKTFDHGATRNQAIAHASGDIVVLMTQDAVPADEFLLEALVAPFSDPMVAGAYARQSPRDDADVLTKRTLDNWLTGRREREVRSIEDRAAYAAMSPMERYMTCNFDNVCSAIRRSVWKDIPLRPTSFGEDIEWCRRALEAGWKIAYEPRAHVIHSHHRPLSYEYRRTYMCHRKLYELFGLRTVPTRRSAIYSIAYHTASDWDYVHRCALPMLEKIRMFLRIPLLAAAGVIGQYRGARDEAAGAGHRQAGV